jgi:SAM-dependent methyltransferase
MRTPKWALALLFSISISPETQALELSVGTCVQRAIENTALLPWTRMKYWSSKLGRLPERGELLSVRCIPLILIPKNQICSTLRFTGTRIAWEPYVVSSRGVSFTRNYYPDHFLDLSKWKNLDILDAGSGSGELVREVRKHSEQTGSEIRIRGIDFAADESSAPAGVFLKRDMRESGLPNESVDLIYSTWSVFSYESLSQPELIRQVLIEFERILRVGGKIRLAPVPPKAIEQVLAEIPGLRISQVGRVKFGRFDPNTLLTYGHYIEIEKKAR